MKLRLLVAAVAAAGFLTYSPRASAEIIRTVTPASEVVTFKYIENRGGTISVKLDGQNLLGRQAGAFYWSDETDPPNGSFPPPIATFCLEVDQNLPAPPQTNPTGDRLATFAAVDPTTVSSLAGKTDAIKALYGNFYDFGKNEVKVKPGENATLANRAFQVALWEIAYDGPGAPNLLGGKFAIDPASQTLAPAQTLLNGLSGGLGAFNSSGYELVALLSPVPGGKDSLNLQDHITVRPKAVPAPPAVLLAGIGVLALFGRARLTRRAA